MCPSHHQGLTLHDAEENAAHQATLSMEFSRQECCLKGSHFTRSPPETVSTKRKQ